MRFNSDGCLLESKASGQGGLKAGWGAGPKFLRKSPAPVKTRWAVSGQRCRLIPWRFEKESSTFPLLEAQHGFSQVSGPTLIELEQLVGLDTIPKY